MRFCCLWLLTNSFCEKLLRLQVYQMFYSIAQRIRSIFSDKYCFIIKKTATDVAVAVLCEGISRRLTKRPLGIQFSRNSLARALLRAGIPTRRGEYTRDAHLHFYNEPEHLRFQHSWSKCLQQPQKIQILSCRLLLDHSRNRSTKEFFTQMLLSAFLSAGRSEWLRNDEDENGSPSWFRSWMW